jgi:hypothetical protein
MSMLPARLVSWVLVCVLGLGQPFALAQKSNVPEIESARRAYWEGRFQQSIEQLEPLIDKLNDGEDLREAAFLLGLSYLALRDDESGRTYFAAAVRQDPSFVPSEDLYMRNIVRTYSDVRKGLVGRLVVTSEPVGARIFVSGRAIGTTPFEGAVVAGTRSVKAELEGYTGQARRVQIDAGRSTSIQFELSREVVSADAGSETNEASVEEFQKIKILTQDGEKTKEADAILVLAHDKLVVRAKKGGLEMKSLAYRDVRSAEYTYSKHPRWKEGLGAAIAVGIFAAPIFFLQGKKHWLTIQTDDDYAVLRLDKNNYEMVCLSFTAASGIEVELVGEK